MTQKNDRATGRDGAAAKITMTRDLLAVANELTAVIAAENAALKGQDYETVNSLYDHKEGLARVYAQQIQSLNIDREVLKKLSLVEQGKLRMAGERLKAVGDENIRLLRGHIKATETMVDAVADAVRNESPAAAVSTFYSDTGGPGRTKVPPDNSFIILNDTF